MECPDCDNGYTPSGMACQTCLGTHEVPCPAPTEADKAAHWFERARQLHLALERIERLSNTVAVADYLQHLVAINAEARNALTRSSTRSPEEPEAENE